MAAALAVTTATAAAALPKAAHHATSSTAHAGKHTALEPTPKISSKAHAVHDGTDRLHWP
jgi:hypothetical protein